MKRLRNSFIAVVTALCFLGSPSQGHAFLPWLVAAAAYEIAGIPAGYWGASLLVNGVIGGALFAKYGSNSASVDSAGTLKQPLDVTYVDLSTIPDCPFQMPTNEHKNVSANIDKAQQDKLAAKTDSNGAFKYPNMHNAVTRTEVPPGDITKADVGDVVSTPYGWKKITSVVISSPESDLTGNQGKIMWASDYVLVNGAANSAYPGFHTQYQKNYASTSAPPPVTRPATTLERTTSFAGLAPLPAPVVSTPDYKTEIKKMLQDPDYVPVFTDDNTGSLWTPPANALTPDQIAQANQYAQSQIASGQAQYARDVANAQLTQAQNDYSSAKSQSDANPGDSALAAATAAALKNLQAAQAAAAAASASAASAAAAAAGAPGGSVVTSPSTGGGSGSGADQQGSDSSSFTAPTSHDPYGNGSAFDFGARFNQFFAAVQDTGMLSLANSLGSSLPSGGNSTMSFDGGRFGQHTFDFAMYGSVFATIRALWLVMCSWFSVKIITLKGGAS